MPRRNNRQKFEPEDFTPAEVVLHDGTSWRHSGPTPRYRTSDEIARERNERIERQRAARVNGGMDWSVCLVPGCGGVTDTYWVRGAKNKNWRDHRLNLPLCTEHLSVACTQGAYKAEDPLMVAAAADCIERIDQKAISLEQAAKKAWLANTDGWIYYLRQNGLIKVGWTRDLEARIKSYGPNVEVLVVHHGTRSDETNLHRQLKPARAKGHEWYEDGPILSRYIDEALDQHGPPDVTDSWTQPKRIVAGRRYGRSA